MKANLFLKKIPQFLWLICIVAMILFTTNALAVSGLLDTTFGTNGVVMTDIGSDSDVVYDMTLQSDGKILLLGSAQGQTPKLMRYNTNGSVDITFGTNGELTVNLNSKIAIQPDGKLIVAGSNNNSFAVARYDKDGKNMDNTFGTNGVAFIPSDPGESRYFASDLAIESDGRIVVVGTQYHQGSNFTNPVIARLNSDGTPYDTDDVHSLIILDNEDFSPNYRDNHGQAVAIQANGKIVALGGMMDDEHAKGHISLVRLNQDSSLDKSTFGSNGLGTVTVAVPYFHYHNSSLVIQPDDRIVVVGTASDMDDLHNDLVLARFNSNGALDTTFGGTGIVITDFGANEFESDVHLQADGKIIVLGTSSTGGTNSLLMVRYNKNGMLDQTFGDNGKLINNFGNDSSSGTGVDIQSDSKVVVAGSSNGDTVLARYIEATFSTVIFKSSGTYDGWILESGENSNTGGLVDKLATTFNVGDDLRDRQYKGIVSFNTSSLPDTAILTSAKLMIRKQGVVGTDPFTTHDNLLVDMRNSAFGNNLVLQIGDFTAAASGGASQERFLNEPNNNWYATDLSSTNLGFISKVNTTQFRLFFSKDDNDDLGADYLKFFTGNSTTANHPQFIVTYYVP